MSRAIESLYRMSEKEHDSRTVVVLYRICIHSLEGITSHMCGSTFGALEY
jgi:hypothetical protein